MCDVLTASQHKLTGRKAELTEPRNTFLAVGRCGCSRFSALLAKQEAESEANMRLYQMRFDAENFFIEAPTMIAAIRVWNDGADDNEPESVTMIRDGGEKPAVVRVEILNPSA